MSCGTAAVDGGTSPSHYQTPARAALTTSPPRLGVSGCSALRVHCTAARPLATLLLVRVLLSANVRSRPKHSCRSVAYSPIATLRDSRARRRISTAGLRAHACGCFTRTPSFLQSHAMVQFFKIHSREQSKRPGTHAAVRMCSKAVGVAVQTGSFACMRLVDGIGEARAASLRGAGLGIGRAVVRSGHGDGAMWRYITPG